MSLTTYSLTGVILITLTQMYGQLVIVQFFEIIHILYIALGKTTHKPKAFLLIYVCACCTIMILKVLFCMIHIYMLEGT